MFARGLAIFRLLAVNGKVSKAYIASEASGSERVKIRPPTKSAENVQIKIKLFRSAYHITVTHGLDTLEKVSKCATKTSE